MADNLSVLLDLGRFLADAHIRLARAATMALDGEIPARYLFRSREIVELDERLTRLRQDLANLTTDDPELAGKPGREMLFEPDWSQQTVYRVESHGRKG